MGDRQEGSSVERKEGARAANSGFEYLVACAEVRRPDQQCGGGGEKSSYKGVGNRAFWLRRRKRR